MLLGTDEEGQAERAAARSFEQKRVSGQGGIPYWGKVGTRYGDRRFSPLLPEIFAGRDEGAAAISSHLTNCLQRHIKITDRPNRIR